MIVEVCSMVLDMGGGGGGGVFNAQEIFGGWDFKNGEKYLLLIDTI